MIHVLERVADGDYHQVSDPSVFAYIRACRWYWCFARVVGARLRCADGLVKDAGAGVRGWFFAHGGAWRPSCAYAVLHWLRSQVHSRLLEGAARVLCARCYGASVSCPLKFARAPATVNLPRLHSVYASVRGTKRAWLWRRGCGVSQAMPAFGHACIMHVRRCTWSW
jgi:hypothetical protein